MTSPNSASAAIQSLACVTTFTCYSMRCVIDTCSSNTLIESFVLFEIYLLIITSFKMHRLSPDAINFGINFAVALYMTVKLYTIEHRKILVDNISRLCGSWHSMQNSFMNKRDTVNSNDCICSNRQNSGYFICSL